MDDDQPTVLDQVLAQMPFPEDANDLINAALVGDMFRRAGEMFKQTNSPTPLEKLPEHLQWIFWSGVWCGMHATLQIAEREQKKKKEDGA